MSIIAEFSVPTETFALNQTLSALPEIVVEVERIVAHDEGHLVPYFWVSEENYTGFEQQAEDDLSIRDITTLDEIEGATLYRATGIHDVETVGETMTNTGAALLDAIGHAEQWSMDLRFDTHDRTVAFYKHLTDNGVQAELQRLYEPTHPRVDSQPGLTDLQHETLVTALKEDYYNTPRDITMDDLAAHFGISQPALSKRLCSGHSTLIKNSLMVEPPDTEPDH